MYMYVKQSCSRITFKNHFHSMFQTFLIESFSIIEEINFMREYRAAKYLLYKIAIRAHGFAFLFCLNV